MHFEFLIEDQSGKNLLEPVLEKILGPDGDSHSYRIICYKGIGRLPRGMRPGQDPAKRQLLTQLPRLISGYGKALQHMQAAVIVVVDNDDRDCVAFKNELLQILNKCNPKPKALFRIAIEECEAWLLGDRTALTSAYPNAKLKIYDTYRQDSICGTWEVLADIIHPGGSAALARRPYAEIGKEKCHWAKKIAPLMNVECNRSPSFQCFVNGLKNITTNTAS